MIRFVDLTDADEPLCGFLSTYDNRFLITLDGTHVFESELDVTEIEGSEGLSLIELIPDGFFRAKERVEDFGDHWGTEEEYDLAMTKAQPGDML